ncbi:MAG: acetylxylan esterase [Chloroflexi bacterium]|nr:acetylxylan esterase [Chloroflexota bacterium]
MDCVRGIDFLNSRSEIDSSRIGVWGFSQGGGLTLGIATLDRRMSERVSRRTRDVGMPSTWPNSATRRRKWSALRVAMSMGGCFSQKTPSAERGIGDRPGRSTM